MRLDWRQILPALAIGLVLGAAGARCLPWLLHGRHSEERRFARLLSRFESRLGLDAAQKGKVETILKEQRKRLDELRGQTRPRFEALRAEARSQIRVLLSFDQQEKYDALEAEMEARRRKRRGGG